MAVLPSLAWARLPLSWRFRSWVLRPIPLTRNLGRHPPATADVSVVHNSAAHPLVIRARTRIVAHAAPKPLSMPITVMPWAHEDSIPSRAVCPRRLEP